MDQGTEFMPGPLERKERRGEGKGNEGRDGEEMMPRKEMCGVAAVHRTLAKGAKTTCSSSHKPVQVQPQTSIMTLT